LKTWVGVHLCETRVHAGTPLLLLLLLLPHGGHPLLSLRSPIVSIMYLTNVLTKDVTTEVSALIQEAGVGCSVVPRTHRTALKHFQLPGVPKTVSLKTFT
jgi:hypothetical protein